MQPAEGRKEYQVWFAEDPLLWEMVRPCKSSLSQLTQTDRQTIWYQPSDFQRYKQSTRAIGRESQRLLSSSQAKVILIARNLMVTPKYKEQITCGIPPPSTSEEELLLYLQRWTRHANSRRGCEQWCNPSHGFARRKQRQLLILKVLNKQAEVRREGIIDGMQIAQMSTQSSASARHFGVNMGVADACAVDDLCIRTLAGSEPTYSSRGTIYSTSSSMKRERQHQQASAQ